MFRPHNVPLFIAAHLNDAEKEHFGKIHFKKTAELTLPFLVSKAVEVVQNHPGKDKGELTKLLAKEAIDFGERFVREANDIARREVKEKRDRKSDPETIRRYVEICDLRKQDRKKWSLGRLAKKYDVTVRAITKILKEEGKWRNSFKNLEPISTTAHG